MIANLFFSLIAAGFAAEAAAKARYEPVSYTHLTLPTICSV